MRTSPCRWLSLFSCPFLDGMAASAQWPDPPLDAATQEEQEAQNHAIRSVQLPLNLASAGQLDQWLQNCDTTLRQSVWWPGRHFVALVWWDGHPSDRWLLSSLHWPLQPAEVDISLATFAEPYFRGNQQPPGTLGVRFIWASAGSAASAVDPAADAQAALDGAQLMLGCSLFGSVSLALPRFDRAPASVHEGR